MAFGRKKKSTGPQTKIFFCSDVHGSTVCFRKFINAAKFYGADTLILGGDVTGKMVVPVAHQGGGKYRTHFAGTDHELETEKEVADFVKKTENMGLYPAVMEEDEFLAIRSSQESQDELFSKLMFERLREWTAYADEKLAGTEIRAFAAPGNDDLFEVDEILDESESIELLEMRVHRISDQHEIITSGWTNRTPWDTERECSEEELAERLKSMIDQVEDLEHTIFNLHVPPHNSKIDSCPKLDDDMQVIYAVGNPVMAPAGSTAVRAAIEEYQPMLGLHGHIHEGRGETTIGRTLCINPGSVYSEGILNGALITLEADQVRDYQFTQG